MGFNYKKQMAIQDSYKRKIKKLYPDIEDSPGIYFITRYDEDGHRFSYVGQAGGMRKSKGEWVRVKQGVLTRLAQHLQNHAQHIDNSLDKHGLWSEDNPYGYKMAAIYFEPEELNDKEQYYIAKLMEDENTTLLNKTSGSQGIGKEKIAEYKPQKGYQDGLRQGYKNASKEIAHLFELHLDVTPKKVPPNKLQEKALDKFNDFLNYHKTENSNSAEN